MGVKQLIALVLLVVVLAGCANDAGVAQSENQNAIGSNPKTGKPGGMENSKGLYK